MLHSYLKYERKKFSSSNFPTATVQIHCMVRIYLTFFFHSNRKTIWNWIGSRYYFYCSELPFFKFSYYCNAMQNYGKLTSRSNKQKKIYSSYTSQPYIRPYPSPTSYSFSVVYMVQVSIDVICILFIAVWNMIRIHIGDYIFMLSSVVLFAPCIDTILLGQELNVFCVDAIFIEGCSPFLYHISHISETLCSYKHTKK